MMERPRRRDSCEYSNKWPQTRGLSGVGSGYGSKRSEGPELGLVTSCLGEMDQERKTPLEHEVQQKRAWHVIGWVVFPGRPVVTSEKGAGARSTVLAEVNGGELWVALSG